MLWRVRDLMEGGGELLKAEAELAVRRVRRGLLAALMLASAIAVAFIGLLAVLASAAIAMAEGLGWINALAILGGGLLLLALIAGWVIAARLSPSTSTVEHHKDPRLRAEESREQMSDAVNPKVSKEEAHDEAEARPSMDFGDLNELKNAATEFVSKNPLAVASGAFLLLSVVGPFRAIRFVSRGLAAAGVVTAVIDAVTSEQAKSNGSVPAASRPPAPRPVPRPTAEPMVQPGASRVSAY